MKTWVKVLIGIAIALVVLLVIAYFGMGYVIYDKLGNVKGSCDEHLANRPDNFALHPEWPAGFDVTPYFMTGYEPVKFPSRDPGIEVAGWWIPASPPDPAAATVILVDGLGGCKNSIAVLAPAGMLWRNGFNVLLIDLRDTGDSTFQDGRSTIGNEEHRDVLGAWDWLVNEKGIDPKRDRPLRQLAGRRERQLRVQRGAAHRSPLPAIDLRQPAADHRCRAGT